MEIYRLSELQPNFFKRPVVTVGIFDGVHRGHQTLLNEMKALAQRNEKEAVLITLWPHPRMVLYPDKPIKLLSTLEEKLELLKNRSIHKVVLIDFNREFAQLTAREFIEQVLVKKLNISYLILGYDNHFGRNKEGKSDLVKEESQKWGFKVVQLPPVFDGEEVISSTNIRLFLELGEIKKANDLLGYLYNIKGEVIKGDGIGRTLGFPTANLYLVDYKMVPRVGVYAVWVRVDNNLFPGMMNIGFRPTINPLIKEKKLEVHIIHFEGSLYGKKIEVIFISRIRDEIKFPDIEVLKRQLMMDKEKVLSLLSITKNT